MTAELDAITTTFAAAAKAGPATPLHAACGLRAVLLLLVSSPATTAHADAVVRLSAALSLAAPAIALMAGPQIGTERIRLGLAAASGLLPLLATPLTADESTGPVCRMFLDHVDHVALIADELDALHRRRQIEARGDLFRKSITVNRAMAATADGASLH